MEQRNNWSNSSDFTILKAISIGLQKNSIPRTTWRGAWIIGRHWMRYFSTILVTQERSSKLSSQSSGGTCELCWHRFSENRCLLRKAGLKAGPGTINETALNWSQYCWGRRCEAGEEAYVLLSYRLKSIVQILQLDKLSGCGHLRSRIWRKGYISNNACSQATSWGGFAENQILLFLSKTGRFYY